MKSYCSVVNLKGMNVFLEVQFLSNEGVTNRLTHTTTERLALPSITPLVVDRFDLYTFFIQNLITKSFLMVGGEKMADIGRGLQILEFLAELL